MSSWYWHTFNKESQKWRATKFTSAFSSSIFTRWLLLAACCPYPPAHWEVSSSPPAAVVQTYFTCTVQYTAVPTVSFWLHAWLLAKHDCTAVDIFATGPSSFTLQTTALCCSALQLYSRHGKCPHPHHPGRFFVINQICCLNFAFLGGKSSDNCEENYV